MEATPQKFAYYASVNANRSNLGLETPVSQIYHDAENGYGGFTSLMLYNLNARNQLRFDAQVRRDFYQIPYDPNPNDFENQQFDTSSLRDTQREIRQIRDFLLGPHFQSRQFDSDCLSFLSLQQRKL